MYNTTLNFYLMYFHLNDFNLKNFKEEVISLFKNDDSTYKYNFQVKSIYYMHLFLPSGEIIVTLPFKLLIIEDKENLLEDLYKDLFPYIKQAEKYLSIHQAFHAPQKA